MTKTRNRFGLVASLALVLFANVSLLANDWPQFRGPTGQGNADATDVPVKWSATENVAWKVEVPGKGWSSPVLVAGKVYLTTALGEAGKDLVLRALCHDATNGKVLWDTELFRPDPGVSRAIHGKNSPASPTPVVEGGRVYVHFGHMGTAALDALSGEVLWRQTEITYAPIHGNGGSPALLGDVLIFSCDGYENPFVVGLDAKTGQVKWRTPRNSPAQRTFSFSTPLAFEVDGRMQVAIPASAMVAAYDPADGKELWRARYEEGYSVVPRPVFAHGLLYVSSAFDDPCVYAVRPAGAQGDVTRTNIAWSQKKGAPATPSPLVLGYEIYWVSDGGIATCADAKTGKVYWSKRLGGNVSASPVSAEGRVYFQNEDGLGFVVKAGMTYELLAENDLEERSLASYAVTDGALFIRSEKHLWRIGAQPPTR